MWAGLALTPVQFTVIPNCRRVYFLGGTGKVLDLNVQVLCRVGAVITEQQHLPGGRARDVHVADLLSIQV